jgi:hypothetical protein
VWPTGSGVTKFEDDEYTPDFLPPCCTSAFTQHQLVVELDHRSESFVLAGNELTTRPW